MELIDVMEIYSCISHSQTSPNLVVNHFTMANILAAQVLPTILCCYLLLLMAPPPPSLRHTIVRPLGTMKWFSTISQSSVQLLIVSELFAA